MFLDDSLVPALPGPGGKISHHDLMNLGVAKPSAETLDMSATQRTAKVIKEARSVQATRGTLKPGMIRRTSSYSPGHPSGERDTRSGVQARTGYGDTKHSRTRSDTMVSGVVAPSLPIRSLTTPMPDPPLTSSSRASTGSTPPIIGGINLGPESERPRVQALLSALNTLTPYERLSEPPPAPPFARVLHPCSLLTPLAIVLEVLVDERSSLRNQYTDDPLPILRDGRTFRLSSESGGQSQLDWRTVRWYIMALGDALHKLLPWFQRGAAPSHAVRDLLKTVRAYVSKIRKVFGQVAGLYVDQYAFTKGWWDESDMKQAAKEVGRWKEMFGT
ncbi:hypothetical protein IAU60_006686 [Kwoniella sp. DSM 27419]